jgi:hypothetical protein
MNLNSKFEMKLKKYNISKRKLNRKYKYSPSRTHNSLISLDSSSSLSTTISCSSPTSIYTPSTTPHLKYLNSTNRYNENEISKYPHLHNSNHIHHFPKTSHSSKNKKNHIFKEKIGNKHYYGRENLEEGDFQKENLKIKLNKKRNERKNQKRKNNDVDSLHNLSLSSPSYSSTSFLHSSPSEYSLFSNVSLLSNNNTQYNQLEIPKNLEEYSNLQDLSKGQDFNNCSFENDLRTKQNLDNLFNIYLNNSNINKDIHSNINVVDELNEKNKINDGKNLSENKVSNNIIKISSKEKLLTNEINKNISRADVSTSNSEKLNHIKIIDQPKEKTNDNKLKEDNSSTNLIRTNPSNLINENEVQKESKVDYYDDAFEENEDNELITGKSSSNKSDIQESAVNVSKKEIKKVEVKKEPEEYELDFEDEEEEDELGLAKFSSGKDDLFSSLSKIKDVEKRESIKKNDKLSESKKLSKNDVMEYDDDFEDDEEEEDELGIAKFSSNKEDMFSTLNKKPEENKQNDKMSMSKKTDNKIINKSNTKIHTKLVEDDYDDDDFDDEDDGDEDNDDDDDYDEDDDDDDEDDELGISKFSSNKKDLFSDDKKTQPSTSYYSNSKNKVPLTSSKYDF